MLDGPAKRRPRRVDRRNSVGRHSFRLCLLPGFTSADEVDASIVRDAEQPRCQRPGIVKGIQLSIRAEQRVLDDILAIQH
jgi:hypothetical protein